MMLPVGYGINSPHLGHLTQNMTADQAYQLRRVGEAAERDQLKMATSKDAAFTGINDQNSIYSSR